ncbi:MAG: glycosyltransferase [Oscillospiraceae bacterium]
MKKVLVLMATYNGEKYLPMQIASLIAQKNVDLSILVRDDGSSDNTCELLEQYQNEGKIRWYTGEHVNVQKGFLELMRKAIDTDADYIAFCDQDDVWDNDKLEIAVKALSEFDQSIPALYYCGQRLVDGNLQFMADHELNRKRSLETRFVLSDFAGCTGVFNRVLLREVLSYDPEYMLMHDTWVLKVCLALGGKVIVDPLPHMSYRQHGGNAVGLGRSVPAYLKQVNQYLNVYKVEPQMRELIKGYGDRMVPQYKEIARWVCEYRSNWTCRRKLLAFREIDFCARGLNLTYWLKVMLNKL